ncbi:MAG: hypothetical protein J6C37_02015 [Roseburia sp.]|nr:hypothetical protein [Roseburia sp.]
MRQTENKRKKVQMPAGIRQKMMAAVSMLLVSSIMLISSTYAWFTLSTAPEVTGITTNIGANGNLEMMLLTGAFEDGKYVGSYYSEEDDLGVISEVGDSVAATKDVTVSNTKWGNLVDLSDSYGLENIVLSPARLNISTAGDTIGTTILKAPSYGSDGRVKDVETKTYTGSYDSTTDNFVYDINHAGVRVIGTTTDVSARLGTYREAKAGITTSISTAKNAATTSLVANGQTLANILVAYATNKDTKFNDGQLKALKAVLTSLNTASESAFTAIKYAVLAYSLSGAQTETLEDEDVAELKNAVLAAEDDSELKAIDNVIIPSGFLDSIDQYSILNENISAALAALDAINANLDDVDADATTGSYTWDQISKVLRYIIDKANVQIAGKTDLGSDDIQAVIDEYTKNQKLSIVMLDGSGVYADLAKLTGDYTVSGLTVHVEYNGINVDAPIEMSTNCKTKATTTTDADGNKTTTTTTNDKVGDTKIPLLSNIDIDSAPTDDEQAASSNISNTYGYMLDFGFRTNAAISDLQLQTAAVNRVYSDETDSELNTQGSGSYMQFESTAVATFSAEEVLALMSAIRVAFVSPTETGADLLAIGALDITREVDNSTGIASYEEGDSVEAIKNGDAVTGYKAGLYLYDYTVTTTADKGSTITLKEKQADQATITSLTQNKAMKVSVIVYLDGDIVDNTMVANANSSMTGHMNLQFSSSATLAPMENTGMREGGSTGTDTEVSYTLKASAGAEISYGIYNATVKEGYSIYTNSANGELYYKADSSETYTRLTAYNYELVLKVTSTNVPSDDTGESEPDAGE